jgi:hypothetical protein
MKENPFEQIMSTREAAILWDMSQNRIKYLAREKKTIARKLEPDDLNRHI